MIDRNQQIIEAVSAGRRPIDVAATMGLTKGIVVGVLWRRRQRAEPKPHRETFPTAAEIAARMADDGATVEDVMAHFGWTRRNTTNMIARGRDYDAFRAQQRARRIRA